MRKVFIFNGHMNEEGDAMYALIYDEFDPKKPKKRVLSAHKTRNTAEKALLKRQRRLSKRVWECYARIVWVEGRVRTGDYLTPGMFDTWAPGEEIPEGDRVSDGD